MAYSARSVPTGDYIFDGEQVSGSQWGPTLNNTAEEDTKEEKKEEKTDEVKPDEKEPEENKTDDDEDPYADLTPFYKNNKTLKDQFSEISDMLRDTHLSTSLNGFSGGSEGLHPISRDMEGHDRQTDSGTLGEPFPSYSTSPESFHLVGAADTTASSLESTAFSYDATSPPINTFSRSLFDNPGSYESDSHNYASAGSTYGESSTLGGSSTYGAYSAYQLGDSSNSALGASSPSQFETSVGSIDMSSSLHMYEGSSKSPYSYGDLSSSTYESSPSYPYGGTSDSAYETSWRSNHP